jgi:hypothetical protein
MKEEEGEVKKGVWMKDKSLPEDACTIRDIMDAPLRNSP